jgi:hypothetical protein
MQEDADVEVKEPVRRDGGLAIIVLFMFTQAL